MNAYHTGITAQLHVKHALAALYWQALVLLHKAITLKQNFGLDN